MRPSKTGPVVLTSDVCYLMENLQKDILPSVALAYDPAGILDGYAWIKHLMSAEGADGAARSCPRSPLRVSESRAEHSKSNPGALA